MKKVNCCIELSDRNRIVRHDDVMEAFTELYVIDPSLRLRCNDQAYYLLSFVDKRTGQERFYGDKFIPRKEMFDLLNRLWLEQWELKRNMGLITPEAHSLT